MKNNRFILSTLTLLAFLPAIAFAGSNIVRPIDKTFDLNGISKIVVSTQGGFIKVIGESRSDAHVVIEQVFRNASNSEADNLETQIESTMEKRGDVLHIEFKIDQSRSLWSFFGSKPSVQFNTTIETAKDIDVELRTSGGPIEATALDSTVQANTSGGPMKFRDIGGPVKAHTSGGPIDARNINGDVDLSTSGGPISVSSITGQTKLTTSGGGIHANDMKGPLNAKTSGGGITASFPEGIDDDTTLRTSGGSITAKLPKSDQFYLNAHTSGGGVRTDFPIAIRGETKRNKAEGPVNGGGPTLDLKTSGGGINIKYL